jgi:hypothetical protein
VVLQMTDSVMAITMTIIDDMTCNDIALIMEAVSTSETSVNFYEITRRNIPEDSHLQLSSGSHSYHHTEIVIFP